MFKLHISSKISILPIIIYCYQETFHQQRGSEKHVKNNLENSELGLGLSLSSNLLFQNHEAFKLGFAVFLSLCLKKPLF